MLYVLGYSSDSRDWSVSARLEGQDSTRPDMHHSSAGCRVDHAHTLAFGTLASLQLSACCAVDKAPRTRRCTVTRA